MKKELHPKRICRVAFCDMIRNHTTPIAAATLLSLCIRPGALVIVAHRRVVAVPGDASLVTASSGSTAMQQHAMCDAAMMVLTMKKISHEKVPSKSSFFLSRHSNHTNPIAAIKSPLRPLWMPAKARWY